MLRVVKGNLFASECQTLVNTVNCVGVMGAGVALEFRLRYPAMYDRYVRHCREGRLSIGKLWLYRTPPSEGRQWVLNFPTKVHWRHPSKTSYLCAGLENFVETHRLRGIESIAFPTLGALNGGIPEATAIDLMSEYLEDVEIDVEIYRYDPSAEDDLCHDLRSQIAKSSDAEFASRTGLRAHRVALLRQVLEDPDIRTIGHLATQRGIGERTLATVFATLNARKDDPEQAPMEVDGNPAPQLIP